MQQPIFQTGWNVELSHIFEQCCASTPRVTGYCNISVTLNKKAFLFSLTMEHLTTTLYRNQADHHVISFRRKNPKTCVFSNGTILVNWV